MTKKISFTILFFTVALTYFFNDYLFVKKPVTLKNTTAESKTKYTKPEVKTSESQNETTKTSAPIVVTTHKLAKEKAPKKSVKQNVYKDEVTTQKSAVVIEKRVDTLEKSPLTLGINLDMATSLKEKDAYSDYLSSQLGLSLKYQINESFSVQGSILGTKELRGAREQAIESAFIGLNTKFPSLGNYLTTAGKLRVYLPVNKKMVQDQSFRARVYTNFSINTDLSFLPINGLSLLSSFSAAKNFHEFTYKSDGSNNTSFNSTLLLSLNYTPLEKLNLSFYGANSHAWDYSNFHRANTFTIGQSLGYQVLKRFSVTLGHEIGGNTFGYDGRELNIELMDRDNSSVYTSLSYVQDL